MIVDLEQRERANKIRVALANDMMNGTDTALEMLYVWAKMGIISQEEFIDHSNYLQQQETDYIFKKANGINV